MNPDFEFWCNVDVRGPDECWEWKAKINNRGYGQPTTAKHRKIATTAHRAAYVLTNGPVESHMKVCHSCDNPKCCNPAHLWKGTNKENMIDCKNKGRTTTGERSGVAKLTNEQAAKTRNNPNKTCAQIAAEYGVSLNTASRAMRGVHYQNAD